MATKTIDLNAQRREIRVGNKEGTLRAYRQQFQIPRLKHDAVLELELRGVEARDGKIVLNTAGIGPLPIQSSGTFVLKSTILPKSKFVAGTNTLEIYPGKGTGDDAADDFTIREIRIKYEEEVDDDVS